MLSQGGSRRIQSRVVVMLMPTLFLVPEVGEEAKEESSHVLHVGRMDIKPLTMPRQENGQKRMLTSLRRTGVMLRMTDTGSREGH